MITLPMRFLLLLALAGSVLGFSAGVRADGDAIMKATAEKVEAGSLLPVFSKITLADALHANKTDGRILVVNFTAQWHQACQQMDTATWRDPAVVEFVRRNGVAIQVDVDSKQESAEEYTIPPAPKTVLFLHGVQADCTTSCCDATNMLSWLTAARKNLQAKAQAIADRIKAGGANVSMGDRLDLAQMYMADGQFDLSRDEFLWLWENMLDHRPSMRGVRTSGMADDMRKLASRSNRAKQAFRLVRDNVESRLNTQSPSYEDRYDWVVLNDVIGDNARTLEWFDHAKNDPASKTAIQCVSHRLCCLLEKDEWWMEFGRTLHEPVARMRRAWPPIVMFTASTNVDEITRAHLRDRNLAWMRKLVSTDYAALLLASRTTEASEVAEMLIEFDNTPEARMALVTRAKELYVTSPELSRLLDEAKAMKAGVEEAKKLDKTLP